MRWEHRLAVMGSPLSGLNEVGYVGAILAMRNHWL